MYQIDIWIFFFLFFLYSSLHTQASHPLPVSYEIFLRRKIVISISSQLRQQPIHGWAVDMIGMKV